MVVDFECVRVEIRVLEAYALFHAKLVALGRVRLFVPHILILEVVDSHSAVGVELALEAKMQSLGAHIARAPLVEVVAEPHRGTDGAILGRRCARGVVGEDHLERLVRTVVETRVGDVGEQDRGRGLVYELVCRVDPGVLVQELERGHGLGDAAVQDDGAVDALGRHGGGGEGDERQQNVRGRHFGRNGVAGS